MSAPAACPLSCLNARPYVNHCYFHFELHNTSYLDNLVFAPPTKKLTLGLRVFMCSVSQYLSWNSFKVSPVLFPSLSLGVALDKLGRQILNFAFLLHFPPGPSVICHFSHKPLLLPVVPFLPYSRKSFSSHLSKDFWGVELPALMVSKVNNLLLF